MSRVFSETQESAEAAAYTLRTTQQGPEADLHAAWTHSEIILAAEARLSTVEGHMNRLFNTGLAMVHGLWPATVVPTSVTRLARWLEAGVDRLAGWRASAARAEAETTLRFIMSWYPGLNLDALAAQRASAEDFLPEKAR